MPFICIGPVCIPWNVAIPVLMLMLKPFWNLLPESWRNNISGHWDHFYGKIRPHIPEMVLKFIEPPSKTDESQSSECLTEKEKQHHKQQIIDQIVQGEIVTLKNEEELDIALNTSLHQLQKISIIKFGAVWCKPCHAIQPDVEELCKKYKKTVSFFDVDISKSLALGTKLGVGIVPAFHMYDGEELVDSFTGAKLEKLKEFVNKANDLGKEIQKIKN